MIKQYHVENRKSCPQAGRSSALTGVVAYVVTGDVDVVVLVTGGMVGRHGAKRD